LEHPEVSEILVW